MVRTQIQLTEDQAAARRVSMAELIRQSIDSLVLREGGSGREAIVARAKSTAGRFSSASPDGSAEHDRHLADAFATR